VEIMRGGVVVLRAGGGRGTAGLVLPSLEEMDVFGSLFPGPEPVSLLSLLPMQWPELHTIHLTV
jgi:hypothetical protein